MLAQRRSDVAQAIKYKQFLKRNFLCWPYVVKPTEEIKGVAF